MIVLITGDRKWSNIERVVDVLKCFPKDTIIIHGAAKGADTIAGLVAKELGLTVREYPAKWSEYGRAAGPIRNKQMYETEKPDIVIAFHNDIENSKGTKHMVSLARKGGTHISLVTETTYFLNT